MKREQSLFILLVLLFCLPAYSHAQSWSGLLDPSRAIDWSGAGVAGGIPNRTIVCATLSPGATAAQINSAISNCPSGQVVKLNAGTYNLGSNGILIMSHNNVTLRGAGADQTFLVFSGFVHQSTDCTGGTGTGNICVRNSPPDNWAGGPRHTANWTAGYAKGGTVITLSSTAGLAVGNMIVLDQLDDSSDSGGLFVNTSTSFTAQGSSGASRTGRSQAEMKTVTAIDPTTNQVTISPGLYMPNWRSSQSPGAWWGDDVIKGVGIEDLSISNSGSAASSILFNNALNCWVKGIRSLNSGRTHIWMYISAHVTVRDSYFYGTQNAASQSYGIETFPSSDSLIENNILHHIAEPIMMNGVAPGTVVSYNFTTDNFYTPGGGSWMQPHTTDHDFNAMELLEGNDGQSFQSDNLHGTHAFQTLFRNYFYGDPSKGGNTTIVHLWAYSRYFNVIGNVLGRTGYYNTYQTNLGNTNTDIYSFGERDSSSPVPDDPNVLPTLMRWGNYDTVSAATRFVSEEVPSGLSLYANPVPTSQILPASFYLPAKPSWWGSMPWPAIGPDVTGGTGPAGHAYAIPAKHCYNSAAKDGNGILIFNAARCYAQQNRPAAPTNLTSIVQ